LEQGNAVLKEIHKEMTVESVEKLMEETAEAQAYQRVSAIITFPSILETLLLIWLLSGNRRSSGK